VTQAKKNSCNVVGIINKKSSTRGSQFSISITSPCYSFWNSRRQEESYKSFHGLQDGDRLTVFFNRTDSFQRTGRFFRTRILNGLSLGFLDIGFSQRLFLERKKLIDIGI
jgi:hypothetical protein